MEEICGHVTAVVEPGTGARGNPHLATVIVVPVGDHERQKSVVLLAHPTGDDELLLTDFAGLETLGLHDLVEFVRRDRTRVLQGFGDLRAVSGDTAAVVVGEERNPTVRDVAGRDGDERAVRPLHDCEHTWRRSGCRNIGLLRNPNTGSGGSGAPSSATSTTRSGPTCRHSMRMSPPASFA